MKNIIYTYKVESLCRASTSTNFTLFYGNLGPKIGDLGFYGLFKDNPNFRKSGVKSTDF